MNILTGDLEETSQTKARELVANLATTRATYADFVGADNSDTLVCGIFNHLELIEQFAKIIRSLEASAKHNRTKMLAKALYRSETGRYFESGREVQMPGLTSDAVLFKEFVYAVSQETKITIKACSKNRIEKECTSFLTKIEEHPAQRCVAIYALSIFFTDAILDHLKQSAKLLGLKTEDFDYFKKNEHLGKHAENMLTVLNLEMDERIEKTELLEIVDMTGELLLTVFGIPLTMSKATSG